MPKRMRVLILCTENSCRSQMAEGFLKQLGREKVDVFSAGLDPKGIHPMAVMVMKEIGLDISNHTSKHLDKLHGQNFDYVITVCDKAARNCPSFSGQGIRLHWPFDDPATATGADEEILNQFRRVRDLIGAKVRQWLTELRISA
jgi:arsenate reductase